MADCDHIAEIAALRAEIRILRKKTENSLANNLCPDHRDKQRGKTCLACEIERLERELWLHNHPTLWDT